MAKGKCTRCGAKKVKLFKTSKGRMCRYCRAVWEDSGVNTNHRRACAIMFNELEKTLTEED